MSTPDTKPKQMELQLTFPAVVRPVTAVQARELSLPAGSVIVTPGKPVIAEEVVDTKTALKLMGNRYSRRTLQRLAKGKNAGKGKKLFLRVKDLAALLPPSS